MPTIATLSVRLLFEHLHAHGIDPQELLNEPWPAAGDLGATRTSPEKWMAMLEKGAKATGEAAFGVQVASRLDWSHLGLLGYLLRSSGHPLEVLRRAQRFHGLMSEFNPLQVQFTSTDIVLSWPREHGAAGQLWDEFGLASTVRLVKLLTGTDGATTRTEFCGPWPDDMTPYHAFFGPDVRFECPMPVLAGSMTFLTTPFTAHDSGLLALLEREAEALLQRLDPRPAPLLDMQRALLQLLPQRRANLPELAKHMHCSERTLQRRLASHGLSFSAFLTQLRKEAACDYLSRTGFSLSEVSSLIGYADQSTFTRAFREWLGTTPRLWRRRHLASMRT